VTARDRRSVVHEAITLPLLLWTVAMVAGARIGADGALRFVPPPLMALVFSTLLIAVLVRSRAIALSRLLAPGWTLLENLTGAVLLAALLLAGAQVFHLLTPERGIFNVFGSVLFLALLLNTYVTGVDRRRLLGALGVVFGSALVLKFVILDGLAVDGSSIGRRLLAAAVEGATLGALGIEPHPESMGYLAFAVVLLFMLALWSLPSAYDEAAPQPGAESGPKPEA
jgi:hypothetical protein